VKSILGLPDSQSEYKDVSFHDYHSKGVQVSYDVPAYRVRALFFYNEQASKPEFASFKGQTDQHIGWQSSRADVVKAYGEPLREYGGDDEGVSWNRLVYSLIDFRFVNGKLVRIAIPGS
jgi:hypothetical protein